MAYALAMEEELPENIELTNEKYVYLPYQIINYDNVQQYITELTK